LWLEKHPEYVGAHKEDVPKYAEEHKVERAEYDKNRSIAQKVLVLTHYSNGKCACVKCGNTDIRVLSIDHIKSGGNKQKKEEGSGWSFYHKLIKNNFPEGYQTLCMNCQFIKRVENNEIVETEESMSPEEREKVKSIAPETLAKLVVEHSKKVEYYETRKTFVLSRYGQEGKCVCVKCGFTNISALSIDHINGNGTEHRKEVGRGEAFYSWLIKNNFPEGYQTLCMNCQFVKAAENNETRG
jgi:hypothetical protein